MNVDVEFFKPFVDGTKDALKTMCSMDTSPGKPFYKKDQKDETLFDIAGVIGVTSETFNGSISLCFPKKVFLRIMNSMLGESYEEINDEVADGAGELLNIIFGSAKTALNEKGYKILKAIPTVVRGEKLVTNHMTQSPVVVLPFESSDGAFHIEISLDESSDMNK